MRSALAAAILLFGSSFCRADNKPLDDLKSRAGDPKPPVNSVAGQPVNPGYGPLPAGACPGHGEFRDDDFRALSGLAGCGVAPDQSLFNRIIRGGAPTEDGIRCLHQLGVTLIVDLRLEGLHERERRAAESLGMEYINVPMNALGGTRECSLVPAAAVDQNRAAVKAAAQAISDHLRSHPDGKVYVHCAHGQDRTGLTLGVYRLLKDQCPKDLVSQEMKRFYYTPYCALSEVWKEY